MNYTYDVISDNTNERNLRKFSLDARRKMFDCSTGCPYDDFVAFYDYYGSFTYADDFIAAVHDMKETTFSNGNSDFREVGKVARAGKCSVC